MSFPLQTLHLLLAEHKARPLVGPVLSLGRQGIGGSYDDVMRSFLDVGIAPAPLVAGPRQAAKLAKGGLPIDEAFFGHLGLESHVLDVSPYEDADIIHDLNQPIPTELKGQFGTVIDGGTIEHVFDICTAFKNIAELVRPGGRIIHLSPCNNYVNHGFWQLSPTAFFDFYEVNGFVDLHAQLIVHPRSDYHKRPWGLIAYDPEAHGGLNAFFSSNDDQLGIMFFARKTDLSTSEEKPTQAFFRRVYQDGDTSVLTSSQFAIEYTDAGVRLTPVRST